MSKGWQKAEKLNVKEGRRMPRYLLMTSAKVPLPFLEDSIHAKMPNGSLTMGNRTCLEGRLNLPLDNFQPLYHTEKLSQCSV